MFGIGKKNVDKTAWANVLFEKVNKDPEEIPEKFYRDITAGTLSQCRRIIMDSVGIIASTKNADTRDGRIELCRKQMARMKSLEQFCDKELLKMIKECEKAMRSVGL